jgi:hypothetical protein
MAAAGSKIDLGTGLRYLITTASRLELVVMFPIT